LRILGIDTAAGSCGVAILEERSLLAESVLAGGAAHSGRLMELIRSSLEAARLTISDIDGFAVTRGPGAFTGLRIGISAAKGLAAAYGKPVVGISSLEALARQAACPGVMICPILDARRGEVYFSRYRVEEGALKRKGEERLGPPEHAVSGISEPSLLIGSGAGIYRESYGALLGRFAFFSFSENISPAAVALLGLEKLARSGGEDPAALVPNYIRKEA
jgi:tRNA threonylcarbamoyladenosine biosynthesis protein TsaB